MAYNSGTVGQPRPGSGFDPSELDRVDRILLGACAAIWLAALGAGVAAVVALVDLGRSHLQSSGESETPWLLYTVIGVSAIVIIGAVPLLIRARRAALDDSRPSVRPGVAPSAPAQPAPPVPPARGVEAPTEKLRVLPTGSDPVRPRPGFAPPRVPITASPAPMTAVDQVWLRFALVIGCAMGVAVVAVGIGTYLMAVDSDAAAWVLFGLTGLITVAMPVIPWFYLREVRGLQDDSDA